ncbi:flagellar filament capping protein FliD [Lacrimispora aerotolerans]|uniref:flagellar filament capping protein FliD n=1 Tax=Lacrimispora aerotolerans TaxID=36832 RepID=UPI0004795606|nr:flagellar filament capping protein FliD [Lacrimispora aerotolerans]
MASVSTTNKTSAASSIRGYGGLASGLDRDTLIEGMTASTRAKIAKQNKSRQTILWKQEAYQSVSSKLVEFSRKYTSYTSPATNISSSSFWAKSSITTNGANSKYVNVTGNSSISDSLSIVGVKSMAQDAYKISNKGVSDQAINTGTINFSDKDVSNLEGEYITFKYGSKTYNVTLKSGEDYDYSNAEGAAKAINESLKTVSIGGDKTLASVINVTAETIEGSTKLNMTLDEEKTAGNTVLFAGGSTSALKAFGITDISMISEEARTLSKDGFSEDMKKLTQELNSRKTFLERTQDKNISFTYNGVTKSIKLGDKTNITDLAKDLEEKLEKQFGSGRISVENIDNKLVFKTLVAGTDKVDTSSVLSITSADKGLLGTKGEFGILGGESNRLNLESSITKAGLDKILTPTADGKLSMEINGTEIEGLTYEMSMKEIMDKINSSNAGVKVSYMANTDKFSFLSTVAGVSGKIELDENAKAIFGSDDDFNYEKGKDAEITVRYGNGPTETLVRGSNSFNLDGLNITINGKFGYDDNGNLITDSEPVTLSSKTNSDQIVSTLTDMIKDFNEIVDLVNKQVSTKPNRDYAPLTDEQKENMSEDQIKKWEEKAKAGILFNDSELKSLSDSLRFIFDAGSNDKAMLSSFGISTSTDYADKGKLKLDETKFRAALEKNPEDLQKLFTKKKDSSTGEGDGFMAKLTSITDRYASTTTATKGILIEKAGSQYAPNSVLTNTLQKSIDSIDTYIKNLQAQLKTETDRYVKQFTNLENVISQMNSQSSWLSSFGG